MSQVEITKASVAEDYAAGRALIEEYAAATPNHRLQGTLPLRAHSAEPGCGDFCFVWSGTLTELKQTLERADATIEEGPVERTGARDAGRAKGTSLYTRDPDNNLLEFIVYEP